MAHKILTIILFLFASFLAIQLKIERNFYKEELTQSQAQYEHLNILCKDRVECDLDKRLLALQNEFKQLRLGIRGIAKECTK